MIVIHHRHIGVYCVRTSSTNWYSEIMSESSFADKEWFRHFESSFKANQRAVETLAEVMDVYDVLRRRDIARRQPRPSAPLSVSQSSGSESMSSSTRDRLVSLEDQVRKLDSGVQQKSKQIESQQALLSDLQSQLSAKETEVRDLTARLATSIAQGTQLQAQLAATHELLQEKEMETIRLRNEIKAIESADKMEFVEELNSPTVPDMGVADARLAASLPRRVHMTHQLSKSVVPPNFVATTRSTSGPQIVAVGTRRLHIFNAISGNVVCECDVGGVSASASLMTGSISPDNDFMLVGTSESQLSLIDIGAGGRVVKDLKGHSGKIKGCGFLGSKSKGFSVSTDRTIKLWDLTRASPIRSVPVTSQLTGAISTMDGTMFVTCHLNGKIIVWSLTDKICEVEAHTDACLGVTISPDGRFIASVGKDDTCAVIDIHMAQSGPIHKLRGFKAGSIDSAPSVSVDSKIISVCGSSAIHSWDLHLGTVLGSVATDATCLSWARANNSADSYGQQVITAHENSVIKWWSP